MDSSLLHYDYFGVKCSQQRWWKKCLFWWKWYRARGGKIKVSWLLDYYPYHISRATFTTWMAPQWNMSGGGSIGVQKTSPRWAPQTSRTAWGYEMMDIGTMDHATETLGRTSTISSVKENQHVGPPVQSHSELESSTKCHRKIARNHEERKTQWTLWISIWSDFLWIVRITAIFIVCTLYTVHPLLVSGFYNLDNRDLALKGANGDAYCVGFFIG